jgi:uncharacterized membrane protein
MEEDNIYKRIAKDQENFNSKKEATDWERTLTTSIINFLSFYILISMGILGFIIDFKFCENQNYCMTKLLILILTLSSATTIVCSIIACIYVYNNANQRRKIEARLPSKNIDYLSKAKSLIKISNITIIVSASILILIIISNLICNN